MDDKAVPETTENESGPPVGRSTVCSSTGCEANAGNKTTKKDLAALEKVFASEIHGRLPFQSNARIFRELTDRGLLQPMQRVFGVGWSAVTVAGYELTHAGRIIYCASCEGEDG